MKNILLPAVALTLMVTAAAAQERTAGQSYDAQVNWSALSSKMDLIITQNQALAASLTSLSSRVDGIDAKINAVIACGKQQKLWNGSSCVAAAVTIPPAQNTRVVTGAVSLGKKSALDACRAKGYEGVSGVAAVGSTYVNSCYGQDCTGLGHDVPTVTSVYCYKNVSN